MDRLDDDSFSIFSRYPILKVENLHTEDMNRHYTLLQSPC